MKLAFVIYPGFTALDLIGPCEVIGRWPNADVRFVASSGQPLKTDLGLQITPTDTPATLGDPDVIVVPGSTDVLTALRDQPLIGWLRNAAPRAQWTASVCTGAAFYAEAGLLQGRPTTTHWAFRENLRAMGATVLADRVVWDANHISGAGVSAGIDMALALTARVHGEQLAKALQLAMEYDPQPPFQSGAPEKADARTLRLAARMSLGDRPIRMLTRAITRLGTDRLRRL